MKSSPLKKSTKKQKKTWANFEFSKKEKAGLLVNSFDSTEWDWNNKLSKQKTSNV